MANKNTIIVFAATTVIFAAMFFFIEKSFVTGLLAGFVTGAVNYFLIVLTVKKLIIPGGEAGPGKALAFIGIYAGKLALLGLLVVGLLAFRKYYSIYGFLAGFTLTLFEIAVLNFAQRMIKRR